ncbi:hypothetical protein GO755_34805 [Spirosoma sp. HMF4905]|uniref:Uncharacterized protein n=1 Tax=Spirosoma arboris TaxID=2682092 RepID=A0A7K1SN68_9BACT|nr:hypothetical protein [Spirosoma arboris]MVM35244.1 hypothetical protein [Spirosoma arboris]
MRSNALIPPPTPLKTPKYTSDPFGRMEGSQIVHVDLLYADGSKGEINITAPHVVWGDDIEQQAGGIRAYLNKNAERLGIVWHHFHAYYSRPDGSMHNSWSWFPYDCIKKEEIRPEETNILTLPEKP